MWTMDNTEGYTQEQLDTINAVLERITAISGEEESDAFSDAINNAWHEGMTEKELFDATAKRLGLSGMTPDRLKAWRKSMSLTQAGAALELGIGHRTYHAYERGEYPVPRTVALACAAVEAELDAA